MNPPRCNRCRAVKTIYAATNPYGQTRRYAVCVPCKSERQKYLKTKYRHQHERVLRANAERDAELIAKADEHRAVAIELRLHGLLESGAKLHDEREAKRRKFAELAREARRK